MIGNGTGASTQTLLATFVPPLSGPGTWARAQVARRFHRTRQARKTFSRTPRTFSISSRGPGEEVPGPGEGPGRRLGGPRLPEWSRETVHWRRTGALRRSRASGSASCARSRLRCRTFAPIDTSARACTTSTGTCSASRRFSLSPPSPPPTPRCWPSWMARLRQPPWSHRRRRRRRPRRPSTLYVPTAYRGWYREAGDGEGGVPLSALLATSRARHACGEVPPAPAPSPFSPPAPPAPAPVAPPAPAPVAAGSGPGGGVAAGAAGPVCLCGGVAAGAAGPVATAAASDS